MQYKKIMLLTIILACLLAVSAVSASDLDDMSIASENSSQMLEEISEKPISSIDEIDEEIISQETNNDGISEDVLDSEEISDIEVLESNDEQSILSAPKTIYVTTKTLTGIDKAISSASDGDTIILDGAYACPAMDWTMSIKLEKKLNFVGINDATLTRSGSGTGSNLPAFKVYVNDVSFKNITFKDFSNNYAEDDEDHGGGAIHSENRLVIDNCTFINCRSITNGGAVSMTFDSEQVSSIINSKFIDCNSEKGGAIAIYSRYSSTVYIENSTFSNNYADSNGGDIYCAGSNLNMINCNFTCSYSTNGGSVYAEAAGERFEFGYTGQCAFPNVAINTCNFENNHATNNGGAISHGDGERELQISNSTFTNCHANLGGSIEWGYLILDNVIFTNCSAGENNTGAFKSNYVLFKRNSLFVNSTYSSDDKEYDYTLYVLANDTFISLQNKINNAEDSSTITLENDYIYDNDTYDDENKISQDGISISKSLTIDGNGHKIDANGKIRIFNIGSEITLKNLILINGYSSHDGGAIFVNSGLTLINCSFYNNEAENGGAVYSTNRLTITDIHFINNTARNDGGAIYSTNRLTISDSCFINNAARNDGGAIYDAGNYFDIANNLFENNTANEGGAISLEGNVEKVAEIGYARYDDYDAPLFGYWEVTRGDSNTDYNQITYQNLIDAGIWNYLTDSKFGDRVQEIIDYYKSGKTGYHSETKSTYFSGGYLQYDKEKLVPAGEGKISKNNFITNNATEKGGSIFSTANNIIIKENNFTKNSAGDGSIICLSNKTQTQTGVVDAKAFNNQYSPLYSTHYTIGERFKFQISFGNYELKDPKITTKLHGIIETLVGYNVTLSNNIFTQDNAETTENVIINEGINTTFENNIYNGETISNDSANPANSTGSQNSTNPTNTNTQTSTTKTTLTLKKVTVKRSAKKLVLQATLKQGNKVLSGKKVTFKFNGKTYKAKTNKNGVAKVTIAKKVLKKLKVGKKVKIQASYGKAIAKKTVKVKK